MTCVNRSSTSVVGAIIFGTAHSSSRSTSERFRFRRGVSPTERVFYPRTAAEVLALDILHDSGGQHITRATVEHHLGRLAAHRSGCSCWRCEAAAKVSIDRVYGLRDWRRTTPT